MNNSSSQPSSKLSSCAQNSKSPWCIYDQLIDLIPPHLMVHDYCIGTNWSYVEADCGMGVSFTAQGGTKRGAREDFRGQALRRVASLAKSWCFEEASVGVAALNAFFARKEKLDALGATYDEPLELPANAIRTMDAFELYTPAMQGKRVCVVGHFPHVERLLEFSDLSVLERQCRDKLDVPDPACEYLIPGADFVFITGVTFINKTAPRLIELSRGATTVFVGPSVIMAPQLFAYGIEELAGSVVADPEKARFAIKTGTGRFFGEALQMTSLKRSSASK